MMEKFVLFGAGELGKEALKYFGFEKIECFIDNDKTKWGNSIDGKRIISIDEYKSRYTNEIIICAAWENVCEIVTQLEKEKILNYRVFTLQLFEEYNVLVNQYEEFEGLSENVWNEKVRTDRNNIAINAYVNKIKDKVPLFHEIEIETINRCNGVCSFCPVNRNMDSRKEKRMDEHLFKKIINELSMLNYAGRVALFSNNEPFLDERILEFSEYARKLLPKAKIHLFTNGTLLTIPIFLEIINYLDELIIDNYNQELKLIPPVKQIKEYLDVCESDETRKKVKILLRKPDEILSSRGGEAPNRKKILDVGEDTCALPFQQLIIRPSGKVSLCCNDPLGKETLGDLTKQTLLEVWYGEKYKKIRNSIVGGRKNIKQCSNCDTFMQI